jgi:cell filamentation protein
MYESAPDPYCYPGTDVLVNRRDLRDQARLDAYEAMITAQRAEEPLPIGAAHLLAELNAVHPFREGNGRTQLAYLALLATKAGHPLALERMDPSAMLAAMIGSFQSDEAPLADLIEKLIG